MVEKCDGCEWNEIKYTLINGNIEEKYCTDCLEEAIIDLILHNNKADFKIKESENVEFEIKSQKVILQ